MEWLTGGECMTSMHDVVVTYKTILAFNEAKEKEGCLWRVSITFFGHIASNMTLKPFGLFENLPLAANYPPINAEEYVEQEIATIIDDKKEVFQRTMNLQVIDISTYLSISDDDEEVTRLCKEVRSNFKKKGAILIKDPLCSVEDNHRFINMIERYFSSPLEVKLQHQRSEKKY